MFYLLQQFLMDHGAVALPGFGTLRLKKVPAEFHSGEQVLSPPKTLVLWQEQKEQPEFSIQPLIGFISRSSDETEEDCFENLQAFIGQLKHQLQTAGELVWPGLGVYLYKESGIEFKPDDAMQAYLRPQKANRVITAGKVHEMLVGDTLTNSGEMQTLLHMQEVSETEISKDRWWIAAGIVGLLGIGLIVGKWMGLL